MQESKQEVTKVVSLTEMAEKQQQQQQQKLADMSVSLKENLVFKYSSLRRFVHIRRITECVINLHHEKTTLINYVTNEGPDWGTNQPATMRSPSQHST